VAKKAIEKLREKKDTTLKVSKMKAVDTDEPPAKRQPTAKGVSKVVGKGKSAPPATTVSTTSMETKTESSAILETLQTECVKEQPLVALRLPPCEKRAVTQVDVDLIISTEASETETENYADVLVAGKEEVYSDVEPCTPERVPAKEPQQESVFKEEPVMVPEVFAGFTESIVIDDDDELGLAMDIPSTTETAEVSTASAERLGDATPPVTPARGQKTEFTTSTELDVTARTPTRPAKVHAPKPKSAEFSMPEIVPVTKVSTDVNQNRVKMISGLHLANAAMDFHLSTTQVAEQLAIQYVLDDEQRRGVIRELQKIRLGAKTLALRIRSEFPLNAQNESDRIVFLNWLAGTTRLAASHEPDSGPVEFVSSLSPSTQC